MITPRSRRTSSLTVVATLLLAWSGSAIAAPGARPAVIKSPATLSRATAARPRLVVIKGGTQAVHAMPGMVANQAKPKLLSSSQKVNLLHEATIPATSLGGPFTLTPARPCVEGRAFLICTHAFIHNTNPNSGGVAYIKSQDGFRTGVNTDSLVRVMFTPQAAGKRYLVDFLVGGGTTYYLTVCSNGQQQTFSGTSHLTFVYEAAGTSTVAFDLTGAANSTGFEPSWQFYACEFTPLN